jgi:hypothetical protein
MTVEAVKVNPVHFKPTWIFARFPDEADELKQGYGDSCLALSDAEMIALRVAVHTFVGWAEKAEDKQTVALRECLRVVLEKIKAMLNIELEEQG